MTTETKVKVLEELLKERGFRLGRGTFIHSNGDELPKWVIDRPDTPEWGGVWAPWEENPEFVEDSEAQVLFELCGKAIKNWDLNAYAYHKEDGNE